LSLETLKTCMAGVQKGSAPRTIEKFDALIEIMGRLDPAVIMEVVDPAMMKEGPKTAMPKASSTLE
jgi:hypothetical protein